MSRLSAWARKNMTARQRAADLRWRQPPALEVHPSNGMPTVYYLTPHLSEPAGGVKVMYRHVDLLNDMGIAAAILHAEHGFRAQWFTNDTRIVSPQTIKLRADDILVIPECYGPGLHLLPAEVRKLSFNQGAYHTFDLINLEGTVAGAPYAQVPNLLGMMTVSRDSEELLRFAFPGLAVFGTRPVIDPKLFHRGPGPLRRRMAFFPDRRDAERHQLFHLLRARGVDWEPVAISGRSEAEVARILRECAVFLSFSEREGFGLPPAEAMASGCYVIGFDGGGGREYFDPAYCSPVTDLAGFAQAVLNAVQRPFDELEALGAKASEQVLGRYTLDGLRADLRAVYERFL